MKIVLICKRLIKGKLGGVERVVMELAKEFKRQGHEIIILSRKENKKELSEEKIEGILIKRITTINISGFRTISSFFKMVKLIRNTPAEIYNSHDWSPTLVFLIKKFKSPYVMTSHGFYADYDNPNKIIEFMEKFVLSRAEKPIICVQKRSSTDYLKKFKFVFIPNGVDADDFKVSKKIGKYALFVGSLDSRKNIVRVCQAFDHIRKKGVKIPLKVVGEGPFGEKLEKRYPFIDFLGHKDGKELIKLYQNCKFFVLPSNAEGFGVVWIEAMACGKPIIASNVGEGPELIKNKNFGRIVEETHSTKNIIKQIMSLNSQIEKEGVKNKEIRDFVKKNYSWNVIVKKYIDIFKKRIKRK
ncbi:MAG: glycosyltransferase family 4 protein [Patescibacteria group bacterium]|nr:glycosyltransferase family 4 protein [Patescibacteria group bacterium]